MLVLEPPFIITATSKDALNDNFWSSETRESPLLLNAVLRCLGRSAAKRILMQGFLSLRQAISQVHNFSLLRMLAHAYAVEYSIVIADV